ncbi:MAG TPA: phospholipase D-like domain-containing protein [Polyangiaceae bacterium]|nr:phospholipase D-like domain-containing protein [Polyangiaceae bacterium]
MRITGRKLLGLVALGILVVMAAIWMRARPELRHHFDRVPSVADPQFARSLELLMGATLQDGNDVRELSNGDEIFPAMLAAIRSAERTITFESYIYLSGQTGRAFAEALAERARAGVKVFVLIDWMGSHKADDQSIELMRGAGVDVAKYNPPRFATLLDVNNRTHRKLLIIDGRIGFTGGVGIADNWTGRGDSPDHWRDAHFRIEGPTVGQMQATFMDNWVEVRPDIHHDEAYFPAIPPAGSMRAQIVHSAPDGGSLKIRLMYGFFVGGARKTLRIANAYFIPEDAAVAELVRAAQRGVNVELVVPGAITDSQTTRHASHAKWGELLAAGVAIYEFQPSMYHCKIMIVDDLWVSVGSTNFDNRSFRINDEANLNVIDEEFAKKQAAIFEADKAHSRRVTFEQWQARGVVDKVGDSVAELLETQL